MTRVVVLLRGVNVSGHKRVPMALLRELAAEAGLSRIQTYINSGNVVATAPWKNARAAAAGALALEAQIAGLLDERLGFSVPVVVRTGDVWARYVAAPPFAEAIAERPALVMLGVSQRPLAAGALELLRSRAGPQERVEQHQGALVLDYAAGSARSKLTPTLLDRAAGSPVTTRNWRSVVKLHELLVAD